MAELDEKLKSLLGDQESLQKVLQTAGSLINRNSSTTAENTPENAQPQPVSEAPAASAALPAPSAGGGTETGSAPDINQLLDTLFSSSAPKTEAEASSPPPSEGANPLSSALPQLLQAFSGRNNYIDENRLNLVNAIKPYMAEARAGSIDRAIKMANMAKAAKMALGLLGR